MTFKGLYLLDEPDFSIGDVWFPIEFLCDVLGLFRVSFIKNFASYAAVQKFVDNESD